MSYNVYLTLVKEIFEEEPLKNYCGPSKLIDIWKDFVESCESGYSYTIWEYNNEIRIRLIIEDFLNRTELHKFQEFDEFKNKIEKLDERLKLLFIGNTKEGKKWWEDRILKYGCDEYRQNVKDMTGIDIETSE